MKVPGWGIFCDHMYVVFLQKGSVLLGFYLNTWKYNVCSIKLERKVLCLHKIRVLNIPLFLVNGYFVHNF